MSDSQEDQVPEEWKELIQDIYNDDYDLDRIGTIKQWMDHPKKDAFINWKNDSIQDGKTMLLCAVFWNSLDIAKLLLEHGADPHISDEDGCTPLIDASIEGHVNIAELLLEKGADPNTQDEDGDTPLTIASRDGRTDIADLLLAKSADPNICNKEGETALDIAVDGGHDYIAELLSKRGADPNGSIGDDCDIESGVQSKRRSDYSNSSSEEEEKREQRTKRPKLGTTVDTTKPKAKKKRIQRKWDLNFTENYRDCWTLQDGIREMVQNAIDGAYIAAQRKLSIRSLKQLKPAGKGFYVGKKKPPRHIGMENGYVSWLVLSVEGKCASDKPVNFKKWTDDQNAFACFVCFYATEEPFDLQDIQDGYLEGSYFYGFTAENHACDFNIKNVLAMGKSSKLPGNRTQQAGKFGEGLKTGALAIVRDNQFSFDIQGGGDRCEFAFMKSKNNEDEETLHGNIRELNKRYKDDPSIVGVNVTVKNEKKRRKRSLKFRIPGEHVRIPKMRFEHDHFRILDPRRLQGAIVSSDKENMILLDKRDKSKVFCKSIYVCERQDLYFGYDLKDLDLPVERNAVKNSEDMKWEISRLLKDRLLLYETKGKETHASQGSEAKVEYLEGAKKIKDRLLNILETPPEISMAEIAVLSYNYYDEGARLAKVLAREYKCKYSEEAFPCLEEERKEVKDRLPGRIPRPVPAKFLDILRRGGYRTVLREERALYSIENKTEKDLGRNPHKLIIEKALRRVREASNNTKTTSTENLVFLQQRKLPETKASARLVKGTMFVNDKLVCGIDVENEAYMLGFYIVQAMNDDELMESYNLKRNKETALDYEISAKVIGTDEIVVNLSALILSCNKYFVRVRTNSEIQARGIIDSQGQSESGADSVAGNICTLSSGDATRVRNHTDDAPKESSNIPETDPKSALSEGNTIQIVEGGMEADNQAHLSALEKEQNNNGVCDGNTVQSGDARNGPQSQADLSTPDKQENSSEGLGATMSIRESSPEMDADTVFQEKCCCPQLYVPNLLPGTFYMVDVVDSTGKLVVDLETGTGCQAICRTGLNHRYPDSLEVYCSPQRQILMAAGIENAEVGLKYRIDDSEVLDWWNPLNGSMVVSLDESKEVEIYARRSDPAVSADKQPVTLLRDFDFTVPKEDSSNFPSAEYVVCARGDHVCSLQVKMNEPVELPHEGTFFLVDTDNQAAKPKQAKSCRANDSTLQIIFDVPYSEAFKLCYGLQVQRYTSTSRIWNIGHPFQLKDKSDAENSGQIDNESVRDNDDAGFVLAAEHSDSDIELSSSSSESDNDSDEDYVEDLDENDLESVFDYDDGGTKEILVRPWNEVSECTFDGRVFRAGETYQHSSKQEWFTIVSLFPNRKRPQAECEMDLLLKDTFVSEAALEFYSEDEVVRKEGTLRVVNLCDLGGKCERPEASIAHSSEKRKKDFAYYFCGEEDEALDDSHVLQTPYCGAEFFSGVGGATCGLENAGLVVKHLVEKDSLAAAILKSLHPEGAEVHEADARQVIDSIRRKEEYFNKFLQALHFLWMSPPCQGYSRANRNGGRNDDANNDLTLCFPDAIELLQVPVGVMENVTAILDEKKRDRLTRVIVRLLHGGYQIRVCTLRASDFGDPQKRNRMFLIAVKKGFRLPDAPVPTHNDNANGDLDRIRTVKDAIGTLPEPSRSGTVVHDNGTKVTYNHQKQKELSADELKKYDRIPSSLAPTTISSSKYLHYDESKNRLLTPREFADLSSFPREYQLFGPRTKLMKFIGNAVPVCLATAVGECIKEALDSGGNWWG